MTPEQRIRRDAAVLVSEDEGQANPAVGLHVHLARVVVGVRAGDHLEDRRAQPGDPVGPVVALVETLMQPIVGVVNPTGAMLERVRQRIFETAQFLFDVLDEGSLAPAGRGDRRGGMRAGPLRSLFGRRQRGRGPQRAL